MYFSARLLMIMTLASSFLLGGCVRTPVDAKLDVYSEPVVSMGEINGALSGVIKQAFTLTPYDGAKAASAPVIIPGSMVPTLNEGQKTALRGIFSLKLPILLVYATEADIDALNAILETGMDFTMDEGQDSVEVYALDYEDGGDLFQWRQYPPTLEDGLLDSEQNQIRRVNLLVEWMTANGARMRAEGAVAAKASYAKAAKPNLVDLATCFVDKYSKTDSLANIIQFTHYIYTCHSMDTGDDWYYVRQEANIDFSPSYSRQNFRWDSVGMPYEIAGPYMDYLKINSWVSQYENNTAMVDMHQGSPATASNAGSVTGDVDYNFLESLIYDAKAGGSAVSVSGRFGYNTTMNMSGCDITNNCYSWGNNAQWTYQMKKCTAYNWFLYAQLTDVPALAHSKFQPVNQWVWNIRPEAQVSPQIDVEYEVAGVKTNGKVLYMFLCETQNVPTGGMKRTYHVSLPAPPKGGK